MQLGKIPLPKYKISQNVLGRGNHFPYYDPGELGKSGGADGTRTRDPRRDRPVF